MKPEATYADTTGTREATALPDGPIAKAPWEPLDWRAYLRDGIPEPAYVQPPFVPRRARIWCPGPQESGKSMWALWTCAQAAQNGFSVAYFSEENPLEEDLRRLGRLLPDAVSSDQLRFYHRVGIDLARRQDRDHLLSIAKDCDLLVLDTLSSCCSYDEDDNSQVAELDRAVLAPATETGTSLVILDHTGHGGRARPRGASAKGQKADVVLSFSSKPGSQRVAIACERFRPGGRHPTGRVYKIVDVGERIELVEANGSGTHDLVRPDLMEAISRYLEDIEEEKEAPSKRQIVKEVPGRNGDVATALKALVSRGNVGEDSTGSGNSYRIIATFRVGGRP